MPWSAFTTSPKGASCNCRLKTDTASNIVLADGPLEPIQHMPTWRNVDAMFVTLEYSRQRLLATKAIFRLLPVDKDHNGLTDTNRRRKVPVKLSLV